MHHNEPLRDLLPLKCKEIPLVDNCLGLRALVEKRTEQMGEAATIEPMQQVQDQVGLVRHVQAEVGTGEEDFAVYR